MFFPVHAKDSTPEFEAVEKQIADDEITGVKSPAARYGAKKKVAAAVAADADDDNGLFVRPLSPIPKSRPSVVSQSSEGSDYTCWGDLVSLRSLTI